MTKESVEQIQYPSIADEINKMSERDIAMRNRMQSAEDYDPSVDRKNTKRLKEIVEEIGWPTVEKVGEKASHWAWLIAQHADHDVAFQKDCLNRMKAEQDGEVSPADIAYLEDRMRANEGKSQIYGTQFYTDENGEFGPRPIEDPDGLAERRCKMGLPPFEAYRQSMEERYWRSIE